MYPIQQSRWIWLLGRGARTRPFARGVGALMELDDLLRPMLLGIMKLRPLSVLSSETGVLGGNTEESVFRFWLR
jgi:hypothetical protein